jgi:hypothetical protein
MSRPKPQTQLTEFDLMVIRAGGHTQAELESMVMNSTNTRCKLCEFLADSLHRLFIRRAIVNRHVQ